MTFSTSQQSLSILYAFILGLFSGLLYDVLKIIRLSFKRRKCLTFALDVLFMVIFAFSTVIFSMGYARGNSRYYILLGEIAGFLLFKLTLGRVILKLWAKILPLISKIIKIVTGFGAKTFKKLLQRVNKILYNKDDKKDVSPKELGEE